MNTANIANGKVIVYFQLISLPPGRAVPMLIASTSPKEQESSDKKFRCCREAAVCLWHGRNDFLVVARGDAVHQNLQRPPAHLLAVLHGREGGNLGLAATARFSQNRSELPLNFQLQMGHSRWGAENQLARPK
ncbi:MAG: hypothetical protein WB341_10860 [Terracidiphilus sp.]